MLYVDANSQQADGSGLFDKANSPTIVDLTFDDQPITRRVHACLTHLGSNKLYALFGPHDPRQPIRGSSRRSSTQRQSMQ